ncbi:methyltransferase domain-containing protein [Streptomyces sp. Z26]|uniref:methyltransferase domain-containing protein n=1 Tax=Streptomyces sp. Z26 TaxID=2500177 RepID=UPI000EF14D49|nr:methyltransferase domain-containing protein [Streptomyces sp. Z26]RLL70418.1 class I SAM-dependent methyltransferase [Streptomyces sp. Z26]
MPTFEELVAEGAAVPTTGWDFSWFEGRATEERPSWGYAKLLAARMARAGSALDVQTGGGEVLATVPVAPPLLAATESWPPNVPVARRHLAPLGATVVEAAEAAELPFPADTFDLVVSRHPVLIRWDEVHRVLRPGGTYLAQHVGAGTVRELAAYLRGPCPAPPTTPPPAATPADPPVTTSGASATSAVEAAEAAGLEVLDVRQEALRMEFHDIAAVVHFLRKVVWTVPDFTVEAYAERLAALHRFIERFGPFVAYAQRFLIEARRPGGPDRSGGPCRPGQPDPSGGVSGR